MWYNHHYAILLTKEMKYLWVVKVGNKYIITPIKLTSKEANEIYDVIEYKIESSGEVIND